MPEPRRLEVDGSGRYGIKAGEVRRSLKETQEKVLRELSSLINEGRETAKYTNFADPNAAQWPDAQEKYFKFFTRVSNLVGRACGDSSNHSRELQRVADGGGIPTSYFSR